MQEIDVIRYTRTFLRKHGLQGRNVLNLYTDAHPSLLIDASLRPFQRFTLAFDNFSFHPDMVGRLNDGETTFAIEAKGTTDLIKGIAQAEIYRNGFHLALFASTGRPSRDLVNLARQRDIGVLAIYSDRVEIIDLPPTHLPQLRHAESVRKQFVTTDTLSRQFYFNLPTHYLCFAPILRDWCGNNNSEKVDLNGLEQFTRSVYTVLPQGTSSFRSALSGAEKLGIVRIQGNMISRTFLGQAVAQLLPDALILEAIHRQIAQKATNQTLASVSPTSAAVLRCLLYNDPVAKFMIDVLSDVGRNNPVSMHNLVLFSAERDKAITPLIFFNPEMIAEITDDHGQLAWYRIQPHHFRSTTFMQYKSILKHAGIIKPHRLGGISAKSYNPDNDIWELMI